MWTKTDLREAILDLADFYSAICTQDVFELLQMKHTSSNRKRIKREMHLLQNEGLIRKLENGMFSNWIV